MEDLEEIQDVIDEIIDQLLDVPIQHAPNQNNPGLPNGLNQKNPPTENGDIFLATAMEADNYFNQFEINTVTRVLANEPERFIGIEVRDLISRIPVRVFKEQTLFFSLLLILTSLFSIVVKKTIFEKNKRS